MPDSVVSFLSRPANYLLILAVYLLILFFYYLRNKDRYRGRKGRLLLGKRLLAPVFLFNSILFSLILVNLVLKAPSLDTPEKLLKLGEELNDAPLLALAYRGRIEEGKAHMNDYLLYTDYHYRCKNYSDSSLLTGLTYRRVNSDLIKTYKRMAVSASEDTMDMGRMLLAYSYIYEGNGDLALNSLLKVKNEMRSGYMLIQGMLYMQLEDSSRAEISFSKELLSGGDTARALENLISLYRSKNNYEALKKLLENKDFQSYTNPFQVNTLQFRLGMIVDYTHSLLTIVQRKINGWDLLAAIWVAATWFIYLIFLNPYKNKAILLSIGMFIAGIFMAFLSFYISDFLDLIAGFRLNGNPIHDLLFCIAGIGLVEESVKFLPLLMLIFFRRNALRPLEYLLFASFSALGFAFLENLFYYEATNLNLIHARGLISTVAHMFFSSMAAFTILNMRKKGNRGIGVSILAGLFAASVLHGFYDFWLVNPAASRFSFITILIYLAGLFLWVRMFSAFYRLDGIAASAIASRIKLQFYLVAGLSSIFMLEYIITGFYFGPWIANYNLHEALSYAGYLLIFLSTRLSMIDFES